MEAEERIRRALADRYTIEERIDSGGMATVYQARDLKHDRTVAIKVLRPDLAEAIGTDRFLREIRTTANLSHPHILPLFDSGEAEGFLFYVMPFVEGESLGDRLEREGQLPVEDAIQIAREVADALAYAHDKGVIHRDIKPANILLERGHALLADFGIAQAKAGAEETKLTGSGMSLGTPSYMSPEQVAGNREMDGRSDQYALASVLYEMLAGHAPFTGADIQAVMRQHLAADAPSMTQARPTVPKGLAKAVHRALAKSPADRFRTMAEFEQALAGATLPLLARIPMGRARAAFFAAAWVLLLAAVAFLARRVPGGAPELSDDLVVVLPFENRTGDARYDPASRRISESITTLLYQARVMDFVSPDLSATFWETAVERRARDPSLLPGRWVAERTGAGIVVLGSLAVQGDSLRVSAQIQKDGGASNVAILDPVVVPAGEAEVGAGIEKMTDRVAAALSWYREVGWTDSTTTHPPPSLAVKEAFDAGWEAWGRMDLERARLAFERTLDLDSTYTKAKVFLAAAHLDLGNVREADSLLDETRDLKDEWGPLERLSWEMARANLDGDRERQYLVSKEASQRGLSPLWSLQFSWHALAMNRPREALDAIIDLDPTSYDLTIAEGWRFLGDRIARALHMLGDHERELEQVLRFRELAPDNEFLLYLEIRARAALGQINELEGLVEEASQNLPSPVNAFRIAAFELKAHRYEEASRSFFERQLTARREAAANESGTPGHQRGIAWNLVHLGRLEEAQLIVDQLLLREPSDPGNLSLFGILAAKRGLRDEALNIDAQLATLGPDWTYSRACIAAQLQDLDQAMDLLEQAYEEGYRYPIGLHADPDLEPLWGFPRFQRFLEPKS